MQALMMSAPTLGAAASRRPARAVSCSPSTAPVRARAVTRLGVVCMAAAFAPPTVSDTKAAFYAAYRKPLPALYTPVVQELLVQHHLVKYNIAFQYDQVYALGVVAILDQILEGLPADERAGVEGAYLAALGEEVTRYRGDAAALEEWAKGLAGNTAALLTPDASSGAGGAALAGLAARAAAGTPTYYSKFVAVGLFRLLELAGAKDPKALEGLCTATGVPVTAVTRDLNTYKAVLSKLAGAKEMMRELLERERRKNAERLAEKKGGGGGAVVAGGAGGGDQGGVTEPVGRTGEALS